MNKLDLIKEMAKTLPSESESKIVINKLFETILDALKNGEKVMISNFGTFKVSSRKAKQARNPKTNEKVMVGAKKSIRFKASKKALKSF